MGGNRGVPNPLVKDTTKTKKSNNDIKSNTNTTNNNNNTELNFPWRKPTLKNCVPTIPVEKLQTCSFPELFKTILANGDLYYMNDSETSAFTITHSCECEPELSELSTGVTLTQTESGQWNATAEVLPLQTIPFVIQTTGTVKETITVSHAPASYFTDIQTRSEKRCKKEYKKMMRYTGRNRGIGHLHRYLLEKGILMDCVQTGMPYVDFHFPPIMKSVYRPNEASKMDEEVKYLYWQRAKYFVSPAQRNNVRVYGPSSISLHNVSQGSLLNCWLIAAVSAVAEHPEIVRRMFAWPENATYGVEDEYAVGGYHVTLNHNGWWVTTILDDYFPRLNMPNCSSYRNRWGFASSGDCKTDLWVPLIEKAYAKLHGSYAALQSGISRDGLQDLTGAPVCAADEILETGMSPTESGEELCRLVHRCKREGHLFVVSPDDNIETLPSLVSKTADPVVAKKTHAAVGLLVSHEYTVIDANYFGSNKLCMFKLRNPWGCDGSWNGNWGANSDMWEKYPLLKLACTPCKEGDGTFWIEWTDLCKYFRNVSLCYLQPTWYDYRVRGMFDGIVPQVVIEISVEKTVRMSISLQQMDKRGMDKTNAGFAFSRISLWITGSVPSGNDAMQGRCKEEVSTLLEKPFKYEFKKTRNISMLATFHKEKSPYLIIPQCAKPKKLYSERSKYVISLNTECAVGADLSMKFKHLDKDCEVFKRSHLFKVHNITSQCAYYQRRNPGVTIPETCYGNAFNEGEVYM